MVLSSETYWYISDNSNPSFNQSDFYSTIIPGEARLSARDS